jgi:drug/metabolite transporter (DMT)-like permease
MNGIKRSSGILGMVSLVGAFSLAGTSVIAARLVSGKLGVFTIAAVSLFFGLVLLVPISGRKLLPSIKALRFMRCGIFFCRRFSACFYFAFPAPRMERTSSLEAGILTGATPAITALLAWVLLREPITSRTLAGLAITILGGFLVHGAANTSAGLTPAHLTGNLLVLCAAASESAFNILSRFSVQSKKNRRRIARPAFAKACS